MSCWVWPPPGGVLGDGLGGGTGQLAEVDVVGGGAALAPLSPRDATRASTTAAVAALTPRLTPIVLHLRAARSDTPIRSHMPGREADGTSRRSITSDPLPSSAASVVVSRARMRCNPDRMRALVVPSGWPSSTATWWYENPP